MFWVALGKWSIFTKLLCVPPVWYVDQHLRYDIALLRLASDATLNSYVQLGSLPPSGQVLPHNNLCYVTGWGLTSSELISWSHWWSVVAWSFGPTFLLPPCLAGGFLSNRLKQAFLPVVDYEACSRSDWWGNTVKTTMVCGGGGTEAGCNVSLLQHDQKFRKSCTHNNITFCLCFWSREIVLYILFWLCACGRMLMRNYWQVQARFRCDDKREKRQFIFLFMWKASNFWKWRG